ncbi:1801_t:CDS:1, partial [Paraglomus occultum]
TALVLADSLPSRLDGILDRSRKAEFLSVAGGNLSYLNRDLSP